MSEPHERSTPAAPAGGAGDSGGARARIESLKLRMTGVSADAATALAQAIGRGLAARSAELRPAALGALHVRVPSGALLGSPDALASDVVERVLRALASGEEG